MKIIISGVPCCGKTYFGDWLRDHHGFTHANLESRKAQPTPIQAPSYYSDLARWLASTGTNVVVTWGFPPNPPCIAIIQQFRAAGFSAWWFDADHRIARERFIVREGREITERAFDPQIQRLNQAAQELTQLYRNYTITTLTAEGYVSLDKIYTEINKNA